MNIRELTQEERDALEQGLDLAAKLVDGSRPLSAESVQELYEALLKRQGDFSEGVIAAGLSFGQLIADRAGYEWVRVSDEYGDETCLSPIGVQVMCAPISMIQKRMSQESRVNIPELRDETIQAIELGIKAGTYQPR